MYEKKNGITFLIQIEVANLADSDNVVVVAAAGAAAILNKKENRY